MNKDQRLIAEAYSQVNYTLSLKTMLDNDRESSLQEGIGDTVKTKVVQPLVVWLLNKVKETSPDTYNNIVNAIDKKDNQTLSSIFNSSEVQQQQNVISQQVTTECLTPISEANQKPSLINSVWTWVKAHPRLTAAAALAALSVLGLATFGAGGVVPLLTAIGTKSLAGAVSGGVGGAVIGGGKSVISQISNTGKVDLKQTAKDTLKGGALGAAAGAIGGAAGAVGQAAAAGAGGLAGDLQTTIKNLMMGGNSHKLMAAAVQNQNLSDSQKKYLELFTKQVASGNITDDDLKPMQATLKLLATAKEPLDNKTFGDFKDFLLTMTGANQNINSSKALNKKIEDTITKGLSIRTD